MRLHYNKHTTLHYTPKLKEKMPYIVTAAEYASAQKILRDLPSLNGELTLLNEKQQDLYKEIEQNKREIKILERKIKEYPRRKAQAQRIISTYTSQQEFQTRTVAMTLYASKCLDYIKKELTEYDLEDFPSLEPNHSFLRDENREQNVAIKDFSRYIFGFFLESYKKVPNTFLRESNYSPTAAIYGPSIREEINNKIIKDAINTIPDIGDILNTTEHTLESIIGYAHLLVICNLMQSPINMVYRSVPQQDGGYRVDNKSYYIADFIPEEYRNNIDTAPEISDHSLSMNTHSTSGFSYNHRRYLEEKKYDYWWQDVNENWNNDIEETHAQLKMSMNADRYIESFEEDLYAYGLSYKNEIGLTIDTNFDTVFWEVETDVEMYLDQD